MGFFIRRIVYGIASFLGLTTYFALRQLPFAIDAALCVAYTVLVIGLAMADKKAQMFSADTSRSMQQMILIHAGFLAGVVLIVRSLIILGPYLPPEFTQAGPGGHSSYRYLVDVISAIALAYREKSLLFHPRATKNLDAQPAAQQSQAVDPSTVGILGSEVAVSIAPPPFVAMVPEVKVVSEPAPVVADAVASAPTRGSMPAPAGYKVVATAASTTYNSGSTAVVDDYDDFVDHMRQGKRPFRKPGVSVKQEYELWRAHREKTRAQGLTNTARA
jgi:hypothetical protein